MEQEVQGSIPTLGKSFFQVYRAIALLVFTAVGYLRVKDCSLYCAFSPHETSFFIPTTARWALCTLYTISQTCQHIVSLFTQVTNLMGKEFKELYNLNLTAAPLVAKISISVLYG